jgi:hygromycin-B 7''-O-kinase
MTALPPAITGEDLDEILADEALLRSGVEALCRDLGADAGGLTRYPTGSLPVYAAGTAVLKLFPQVYADEYPVEAGVLAAVQGRLPIRTPAVRAAGVRDGWGYVLMDRLPGAPLADAWPRIDRRGRDGLAVQLGEAMAALHALPPPDIADWWPENWDDFVDDQRASCLARQRGLGLAAQWARQIPSFLDTVDLGDDPPVLLHTEVMRQHLLVERDGDGWRFSGLFDFEPAMRGAREYEFVGLGCFVAGGDARFLGRTLRAYGYDVLDGQFRRRVMAWSLLHYYSNLAAWIGRLPEPATPTLDALAERWFATGD